MTEMMLKGKVLTGRH